MTRSRTSDEAIYRLIRQGVDDARHQLATAFAIIEMRGCVSEDVFGHISRAVSQYEESEQEFRGQSEWLNSRQRYLLETDLRDIWRKFWVVMVSVSRMAKGNPVMYNGLRSLRLKFAIAGGSSKREVQAAGGL